jgi:pyrroline-5-carboxylate reductase
MNSAADDSNPIGASGSIAFIGGGNMSRSLIGGLIRSGTPPQAIAFSEPNAELRGRLADDFQIAAFADNATAAAGREILVLAVKPQVMKNVCSGLSAVVRSGAPLIISIAAGIRLAQMESWFGGKPAIVRCMPNTPALIGAGATALYANAQVDREQRAQAQRLLAAAGITVWLEREEWVDIVTALSGSGPAYFFLLAEALEEAAVAQGLPREIARALAEQTCLGAGRMLREDGAPAATLRERVTSPNGTTQAALQRFADGGLRDLVAQAVVAATERGREMSRQYD